MSIDKLDKEKIVEVASDLAKVCNFHCREAFDLDIEEFGYRMNEITNGICRFISSFIVATEKNSPDAVQYEDIIMDKMFDAIRVYVGRARNEKDAD